jgi:hypothetical protein
MVFDRVPTRAFRPQRGPRGMSRRRRVVAVLLQVVLSLAGLLWTAPLAAAQGEGFISREYPLKALFLYNFGGYVEWPDAAFPTSDHPFVIGVLGSAPLEETLREIALTRKVASRQIVVKQFTKVDAVEPCHILFVARNVQPHHERQVLASLQGRPVLIVGETGGFAARGGCVNFYIESNKIRFEINLEAARQQQLKISAKLLALAKIVP